MQQNLMLFFDVFFIVKVSQRRRKGYQKSN